MIARDRGKTVPQLPSNARSQIRKLDVSTAPVIITLNSVGDSIFVDANLEEEQCVGGVMHLGIIPSKEDDFMVNILTTTSKITVSLFFRMPRKPMIATKIASLLCSKIPHHKYFMKKNSVTF